MVIPHFVYPDCIQCGQGWLFGTRQFKHVCRAAYAMPLEVHIHRTLSPQRRQVVANGALLHANMGGEVVHSLWAELFQYLYDALACGLLGHDISQYSVEKQGGQRLKDKYHFY
jgi:hypothetical protein